MQRLEANHSNNCGIPNIKGGCQSDRKVSDLLQNLMSTSHTIRANAQEV